jgi:hypothetical protein
VKKIILLFVVTLAGCGYGKVACQIVDTAADACQVVRYLGPDGKPRDVRVPREELIAVAQKEEAKQAAAKARANGADPDAGAAP